MGIYSILARRIKPPIFILLLGLAGVLADLHFPSLNVAQEEGAQFKGELNGVKSELNDSLKLNIAKVQGLKGGENRGGSCHMLTAAGIPVPIHTLERGHYSGVREPLQIVIRSQEQWDNLWKSHSSIEANPPSPPRVDFATEMVVGIFLGEKSTGGYEVEIFRVERRDSTLYLYYREKSPSPGMMVTQVMTQPYHLVKVSKYDIHPIFLREGP
jgi:hypothetical protein